MLLLSCKPWWATSGLCTLASKHLATTSSGIASPLDNNVCISLPTSDSFAISSSIIVRADL